MDILQTKPSHQAEHSEDRAIIETLRNDAHLPGMSDADAIFLMHLDVPEAIMKKLRAH